MRRATTAGMMCLLLAACGGEASGDSGSGDDGPAVFDEIPSQDEMDAEAASTIDESNADAEFEKLMQEVEDDSGN